MFEYILPSIKFCNPQYTSMIGIAGLKQSFNVDPIEFPTFAALDQSESGLIGFP